MIRWLDGSLGQRSAPAARAALPARAPSIAPPRQFSVPAYYGVPEVAAAAAAVGTWQWVISGFSGSGKVTLAPGEDPEVAACEWAKANVQYGHKVMVNGWTVGPDGNWQLKFSFVTDAAFWGRPCGPARSVAGVGAVAAVRWLGQPPTPVNWTGVPKPPYWDVTGLPWPPQGPLPAVAPPGWAVTGLPWPPPPPPGWPPGWPFPLPIPPAEGAPPGPPPAVTTAPTPTAPTKPAEKKDNTAIYVIGGIAIVGLVIAAAVLT